MNRRARLFLFLLGLLIFLCSLAALGYAYLPVEGLRIQATLAPTLLVPP